MNSRDKVFDLMKGVGILLMVYYHLSSDLRPIIYSFHMPLFFILSGYFTRNINDVSDFWLFIKSSTRRLLTPYLVTMSILLLIGCVKLFVSCSMDTLLRTLQCILWSGADLKYTKYGAIACGPLWFLMALFWSRLFFCFLQLCISKFRFIEKLSQGLLLVTCTAISVMAVMVHPILKPAPLSIIQGSEALVFLSVGYCVKKGFFPRWSFFVAAILWPVAIVFGGVDMMFCYLKIYPLSVIGACGGTYVIYLLCKWANSFFQGHCRPFRFAPQSIVWCGRYSLAILCMHSIDMLSNTYLKLMNLLPFNYGEWGVIGFRFAMAILLAVVVTHFPVLKKVYA